MNITITTTITPAMAKAEQDRRAANRAAKAEARRTGGVYRVIPAENDAVRSLSGEALEAISGEAKATPTPKNTPAKVRTTPAWNEPGARGGDPLKRNKSTLASLAHEQGTPEWWAEYRSLKGLTNEQVCERLAEAGAPAKGWANA